MNAIAVPRRLDAVYKPFFIAAIAIALTLGATWGARLLWEIGAAGTFSAATIHEVNAHGEAQIFGWVGLFIMGFACQVFPRMWQTSLAGRSAVPVVFGLMLIGLVVRTIGMSSGGRPFAVPAALTGSAMEVVAVWVFAGMIVASFKKSHKRFEPYVGFIMASLAWMAISSVFSMAHTWLTMTAGSRDELLYYVSTYQGALRDAQIHGVALLMIIGVSLRLLPAMFRVPALSIRRQMIALGLMTIGVAAEVGLFIAFRWTEEPMVAGGLYASWMMLAAGVATIVVAWRPCRPFRVVDRSAKFVRAAYMWLAISFGMLLLLPAYQWISGLAFSHAYYGAIRHAITVGFVSMMILGIGSKVIPSLRGFNARRMSALWGPFLLLNAGCSLRVVTQTLTDSYPGAFRLIGISGTLEVIALGWWGINMIVILCRRGAPLSQPVGASIDASSSGDFVLPLRQSSCSCCSACDGDATRQG